MITVNRSKAYSTSEINYSRLFTQMTVYMFTQMTVYMFTQMTVYMFTQMTVYMFAQRLSFMCIAKQDDSDFKTFTI